MSHEGDQGVRPERLEAILESLEEAAVRDLTVIPVHALGALADPTIAERWLFRAHREKYSRVVKIELVCNDDEAPRLVEIIRTQGRTGARGDGRIFVAAVEHAVNVRTGEEGEEAL